MTTTRARYIVQAMSEDEVAAATVAASEKFDAWGLMTDDARLVALVAEASPETVAKGEALMRGEGVENTPTVDKSPAPPVARTSLIVQADLDLCNTRLTELVLGRAELTDPEEITKAEVLIAHNEAQIAALEEELLRVQIAEVDEKRRALVAAQQVREQMKRDALYVSCARAVLDLITDAEGETGEGDPEAALVEAIRSGRLVWSPLMGAGKAPAPRATAPKGEGNGGNGNGGGRKLEPTDYALIRADAVAGMTMKAIAEKWHINPRYARSIVIGRRRGNHVTGGPLAE